MNHRHRRAKLTSALLAATLVLTGMSGAVAAEAPEAVPTTATTNTIEEAADLTQEQEPVEEPEVIDVEPSSEESPAPQPTTEPQPTEEPKAPGTTKPQQELPVEQPVETKEDTSVAVEQDSTDISQKQQTQEAPATTKPDVAEAKTQETALQATAQSLGGTLDWGVRESFRDYLGNAFVGGEITVADGATDNGTSYRFTTDSYAGSTVKFTGSVHFTGHHGVLDVKYSAPHIRFTSTTTAVLSVQASATGFDGETAVNNERLDFATLTFAHALKVVDGELNATSQSAKLTTDGARAFAGFYEVGDDLDNIALHLTGVADLKFDGSGAGDGNGTGTPKPDPGEPNVPQPDNGSKDDDATPGQNQDDAKQRVGSLSWGFKESFRKYIQGPIANGQVDVADGAVDKGDNYLFQQSKSTIKDGTGTVDFAGSVRFTGHHGELDSKFSNPQIKLTSKTSGQISLDANTLHYTDTNKRFTGQRVVVAEFTGAKLTTNKDKSVTYTAGNVTLTSGGNRAFSDFYQAGDALDAITFTIGADKNTNTAEGPKDTTKSKTDKVAAKKAGTYKQAKVDEKTLLPGGRFTITADGFGSNTKNIRLYVYSEPVLLKRGITADAKGRVSVTATLPENLAAGNHTLSLEAPNGVKQQVSIKVLPFDKVDEKANTQADQGSTCVARMVSGATLSWGFKQSYINYVNRLSDGSITTSGVSQSGGTFGWSGGTGKYNEDGSKGVVSYGGALRFTGHKGIMDSNFKNIRVQFNGPNSASIIADVVANNMEGETSTAHSVYMATISLAGNRTSSGSTVTWSNAPVSLTAAGATAFGGFYEAGQAMDPATLSITLGAETNCDQASGTAGTVTGSGVLSKTGVEGIQAGLAAALFLLLAGTAAVIANRRHMVRQR
jgi:hypothetical protein